MAEKKKGIGNTLIWILMGLLILSLGGFGITNLGGTVRSIGSVGETPIDVQRYFRALQGEISALQAETGEPVSFAQAQNFGAQERAMSQMVTIAAFDEETRLMGISVGDEIVRDEILSVPGFQGLDGEFDREAYRFTLQQSGFNEQQFEDSIRRDTARSILQGAVLSGIGSADGFGDTIMTFVGEERDISYTILDRDDLITGAPVPQDADLQAYHSKNEVAYTTPEVKRITYAWLTPDMLLDSVEIDEASLRDAYETRIDEFVQPERRLVERLIFPDVAAAQAALARVTDGSASFEQEVEARNLTLADIDLGDVTLIELGAAGEAIFAADAGDVVGPFDNDLGPALFRMNAVLKAQETSFEEAMPILREGLAADRARRVIDAQIEDIDDLLAGGATIEDLGQETEMQVGQIDWHQGLTDGIGGYEAFRRAAAAVTSADYPEIEQLEDEGIFALRLDEVVAPRLQPLDEVRDAVANAWRDNAVADALEEQVAANVSALQSGSDFADFSLTAETATGLTRQSFNPNVGPSVIEAAFEMSKDEVQVIKGQGQITILRLDNIAAPDPEDDRISALRAQMDAQAQSGVAQDLFQALADDIRSRVGISLDQHAINAVHANFN